MELSDAKIAMRYERRHLVRSRDLPALLIQALNVFDVERILLGSKIAIESQSPCFIDTVVVSAREVRRAVCKCGRIPESSSEDQALAEPREHIGALGAGVHAAQRLTLLHGSLHHRDAFLDLARDGVSVAQATSEQRVQKAHMPFFAEPQRSLQQWDSRVEVALLDEDEPRARQAPTWLNGSSISLAIFVASVAAFRAPSKSPIDARASPREERKETATGSTWSALAVAMHDEPSPTPSRKIAMAGRYSPFQNCA